MFKIVFAFFLWQEKTSSAREVHTAAKIIFEKIIVVERSEITLCVLICNISYFVLFGREMPFFVRFQLSLEFEIIEHTKRFDAVCTYNVLRM